MCHVFRTKLISIKNRFLIFLKSYLQIGRGKHGDIRSSISGSDPTVFVVFELLPNFTTIGNVLSQSLKKMYAKNKPKSECI